MNGLAVLISWGSKPAARLRVERMLRCMSHRGGKGQAIAVAPEVCIGTSSCPASSDAAISSKQRTRWCVADVRLDNREELISKLKLEAGEAYSDAELLLRGFERWGTALAEKLAGDFAFAIWDEQERSLYAARDPFGVRTLFYRNDGNEFLLASEMEPLLEADGVHNELEDEAVLDYLLHDHRSRRETFFRGLLRVQPGHWLLARAGVVGECPYWRPPAEVVRLTDEQEYAGEFRRLFLASVEARLDRDCPTVAQLSGGLDSSSIVAAAQEICRRDPERPPVIAATAVYPGLPCDESAFVDAVDRAVRFRIERWNGCDDGVFDPDAPIGVAHPGDECSPEGDEGDQQLARRVSARGILSGFGGDQLLFERGVYRDLAAAGRWWMLILQTSSRSYSTQGRVEALAAAIRSSIPSAWRRLYRRWRPARAPQPPAWLGERLQESWSRRQHKLNEADRQIFASHCQETTWRWLASPHLWWSLEAQVLSAARRGLEMRFPYLDSTLARFVLSIPSEFRLPLGRMKRLLRLAMKGLLPSTVLNRRRVTTFDSLVRENYPRARPELTKLFSDGCWLSSPYLNRAGVQALLDVTATDCASSPEAWGAMSNLLDIAQLEVWLRGLHNRGVLQLQGAIH